MDCDEFINDDEVVFENDAIQEAAYGGVFSDEEIDAPGGPSLVSSRGENAYDKYAFHLDVVFRSHGSPKITWRAPNGEVIKLESNRIELCLRVIGHGLYNAKCTVSSVTEEDEGSYTCLMADEFGDLKAEICAFRCGHRRSVLDANSRVEQDHGDTPEAVNVAASSGDGRGPESTTVSVEEAPKVITMILDSENKLMVDVEFQSRSEVASPRKRIMIGELRNKCEDVFVAELQLDTVSLEAGTYTCIISNDSRSVEARFEVQVAVLPEEPMKLVFDEPAFTYIPIVNEMQAVSEEPIKEELFEIEGPKSDTSVEPKSEYTIDFEDDDIGVHVDTSESHVEEIMEEHREVQNDGDENDNEAWSENDQDLLSPDLQIPEETLEQSVENSPVQEMEEVQEDGTADWNVVVGDRRLVNVGQTCYLNSTLQALAACPPFSRAVLEFLREVSWDFTRAAVVNAEIEVLQEILQTIVKLASPQMPTSLLKQVVPSGTDLRVSEETLIIFDLIF